MMKILVLKKLKGLVAVVLLCVASNVSATTLFNAGHGLPDIQSQDLTVDYDTISGDFNIDSASSFTFGNYLDSAGNNHVFLGTFLLDFSVDGSGALDNSGSFAIADSVNALGFGLGATLLSGFVTDFAFSNTTFEVLLNITSGFLSTEFGLDVGVIIAGSGVTGFLLDQNFFQEDNIASNTFKLRQVPEPSILVLFAIAGLSFFRKGKQQG